MRDQQPGSIWPATDAESAQIREVYSRYGLAMYSVQCLEHGMVNTVLMRRLFPTMRHHAHRAAWEDAFDKAYEIELGRTYGNILRGLETVNGFPADLLSRLRAAKEDRDTLAHRFFREHDLAFLNPNGRTAMIIWCEERIMLFNELAAELDQFDRVFRIAHGVTDEWLENAYASSLEQAKGWTAPTEPGHK